jgi:DNA-3-methyladenine glycosylase
MVNKLRQLSRKVFITYVLVLYEVTVNWSILGAAPGRGRSKREEIIPLTIWIDWKVFIPQMDLQETAKTLDASFYRRTDTTQVARELLGKLLVTTFDGQLTAGRIVETEAYKAPEDKACHAYLNRNTKRTRTMFLAGGVAYIYLCYGIHHLFNVVTGPEGAAHAVLVRAVEPVYGTAKMMRRRGHEQLKPQLSAGPGVMSQALGLHKGYDGCSLLAGESEVSIWEDGFQLPPEQIVATPRIGIDYAEECKDWPWRFCWAGNPFVSKPKPKLPARSKYDAQ